MWRRLTRALGLLRDRLTPARLVMSSTSEMQRTEIGIIGMGDMGRLYARCFSAAGWKHVNVCDLPENYEKLRDELEGAPVFSVEIDPQAQTSMC